MLAVVDDAHWLDDASAAALLFAARRLEGEPVALLFAVRDDEAGAFDGGDLPVLDVARRRRRRRRGAPRRPGRAAGRGAVRAELLEVTAGNPLGLVELTGALTAEQLAGREPLPDRLPLTAGVERAFLDRYRRLPATGAPCCWSPRPTTPAAPHRHPGRRRLGAGDDALDAAEHSGLLVVDDGTVTLRHPLVRSAIYGAATSTRRRQAHRALADALAGTTQDDRRAWHLAASVDGPDEEVVAALDEAAERARRAVATRPRGRGLDPGRRAHRPTPRPAPGGSSRPPASQPAAGRPADTRRLAGAALVDAADPLLRADLLQLQGQVEWNNRSLDDGYRIVLPGATTAAPHDPARARVLAMLAAALASFGARSADAPEPSPSSRPPGAGRATRERVAGPLLDGFTAVRRGDWAEAATALRARVGPPDRARGAAPAAPNLAIATMHLGDDERAIGLHDLQLQPPGRPGR